MLELKKRGIEQAFLCRPGGNAETIARENGIAVQTWKPPVSTLPMFGRGYRAIVEKLAPDIVHTRLSAAARIAGFWGKKLGTPTVATFDKPAKAKYYRKIDHYISCAAWLKKYMVDEQHLPPEKIDVVYNAVDIERYTPDPAVRNTFRQAHGIRPHDKVISGLGIYIPRKGFETLIRAFSQISRERGDLHLMLIGDGELRGRYLELIEELGLQGRVIMPPEFVKDVRPWLWGTDYYVMPSREEGFSIALLEVMAAGLPVIVSDIEAFTEIIEEGKNGLIAGVDDVQSFSSAMRNMLGMSDKILSEIKTRSLETARRFSNEAIAEETIGIYRKILGARG